MFSVLRRRFGYANVVATLALVFAMSGGAYAASKFLIVSTKQIKPSVLAQLKGKNGKNGVPGAQGVAGSAGPVGPQGPGGANGKDGAQGAVGLQGPAGAAGSKGATGATGPQGEPWTAGGTLPKGATETGTWTLIHATVPSEEAVFGSISFSIPLPSGGKAYYIDESESKSKKGEVVEESGCTGDASEPTAPEGKLCIYAQVGAIFEAARGPLPVSTSLASNEYGKSGAFIELELSEGGSAFAVGSWAVTAAG